MPSHHDYGIDQEHFFGGTPDDEEPRNTLPDDACPACGQIGCVGYCEAEDFDPPPTQTGPFLCVCCHKNGVDALNGFDTCEECLARQ